MPSSNAFTKFADSLEYISQNVSSALAAEAFRLISNSNADLNAAIAAVAGDVSTSGAGVFFSNGTNRRRALRALLLCQRVFLSDLYQRASLLGNVPGGWPASAVSYWSSRSEPEIQAAIGMFVRKAAPDSLTEAARQAPQAGLQIEPILCRITRNDNPFPIDPTCYRAVQSWLLKAGYVSLQWYARGILRNAIPGVGGAQNKGAELLGIFGQGQAYDVSADGGIPALPAGRVIYMYKADAHGTPSIFGALGHWMVTDGGDRGYGCNNSQGAADRPRNDYALCSIGNQIREMRPEGAHAGGMRTYLRVYDPLTIGV